MAGGLWGAHVALLSLVVCLTSACPLSEEATLSKSRRGNPLLCIRFRNALRNAALFVTWSPPASLFASPCIRTAAVQRVTTLRTRFRLRADFLSARAEQRLSEEDLAQLVPAVGRAVGGSTRVEPRSSVVWLGAPQGALGVGQAL